MIQDLMVLLIREFNDDISAKQIERNGSERESNHSRFGRAIRAHAVAASLLGLWPYPITLFLLADRCLSDRTRKHYFHPSQPSTSGLILYIAKRNIPHKSKLQIKDDRIVFTIATHPHISFVFFFCLR